MVTASFCASKLALAAVVVRMLGASGGLRHCVGEAVQRVSLTGAPWEGFASKKVLAGAGLGGQYFLGGTKLVFCLLACLLAVRCFASSKALFLR